MFVDKAKITIKAGNGGNGAVSFHREKYVAAGGPDGGDGGNGGSVYFQADDHMSTLVDFRYKRKYAAQDGQNGGAKRCSGKKGADLVIKVPRGTLILDAESGRIHADISGDEPVLIAKGGRGGAGNQHFATPTRQIPKFAKPGTLGESFELNLELKLLADVGLVGFPNVGKSTLISVVSAAKPKIANYHFTTLSPVLGVVQIEDGKNFVMADIPGLIEGASDGIGLGHEFLRHVDRCRLIVHVVDVSGIEGRDPIEDFQAINRELENFSQDLAHRPQIVVANKTDMATEEQIEAFKQHIQQQNLSFFCISAATTAGTKELVAEIAKILDTLPPIVSYEADPLIRAGVIQQDNQKFEITCENNIYYIQAPFLEQILSVADMQDYESLQYFQRVLRFSGIIDKLEEMGIQEGQTVDISGFQFDFVY